MVRHSLIGVAMVVCDEEGQGKAQKSEQSWSTVTV